MTDVDVAILHLEPGSGAGPLTHATHAARRDLAERHRRGFLAAGGTRVSLHAGDHDDVAFGARLRDLAARIGDGGLVVLGSGAIPLATRTDRVELVEAARAQEPQALTNNAYSADVVAVARARSILARLPDLATDNMLPRWLEEVAAIPVAVHRARRRLAVDIDGPLDLVLLGGRWMGYLDAADTERVRSAITAVRAVARDAHAELLIYGRASARDLAWLERNTASRTRALIEERGLRARRPDQRPAASVLGALLDRDGPESLGTHVARLADAAIIDSRVLIAHRCGADERGWPAPEDRFASDLLLADRVVDPWLRTLTTAAATAPVPIVLSGHTLVGPGLPLALGGLASIGR